MGDHRRCLCGFLHQSHQVGNLPARGRSREPSPRSTLGVRLALLLYSQAEGSKRTVPLLPLQSLPQFISSILCLLIFSNREILLGASAIRLDKIHLIVFPDLFEHALYHLRTGIGECCSVGHQQNEFFPFKIICIEGTESIHECLQLGGYAPPIHRCGKNQHICFNYFLIVPAYHL